MITAFSAREGSRRPFFLLQHLREKWRPSPSWYHRSYYPEIHGIETSSHPMLLLIVENGLSIQNKSYNPVLPIRDYTIGDPRATRNKELISHSSVQSYNYLGSYNTQTWTDMNRHHQPKKYLCTSPSAVIARQWLSPHAICFICSPLNALIGWGINRSLEFPCPSLPKSPLE